jgi:peptidoglycan/xylan/chitin deacetylase (PgdA/CDA1 family)
MQEGGMDFGSHTHTHSILSKLSLDEQVQELSKSRAILEKRLGTTIDTLSYPVGEKTAFNSDSFEALSRTGYRAAFSFYGGCNPLGRANIFDLLRVSVEADVSWPRFRLQCALAPRAKGYWF